MRLIDVDALLALYPDCRGLKDKVDAMPTAAGEWVDCSEQLPETTDDVLVCLIDGRVEIDYYDAKEDGETFRVMSGDLYGDGDKYDVTVAFYDGDDDGWDEEERPYIFAWMPLRMPQKPKWACKKIGGNANGLEQ